MHGLIEPPAITRELSLIEAYETRLVDAIKRGQGELDPLLTSLAHEEARKKALITELDQLQHTEAPEFDTARLRRDMKKRLADLPTLLGSHISEARKLFKTLFEEGLKCWAEGSTMTVSGTGDFMRLVPNSPAHLAWCPQRD